MKIWASTPDGEAKLRAGKASELVRELMAKNGQKVATVSDLVAPLGQAMNILGMDPSQASSFVCAFCDDCDVEPGAPEHVFYNWINMLSETTAAFKASADDRA